MVQAKRARRTDRDGRGNSVPATLRACAAALAPALLFAVAGCGASDAKSLSADAGDAAAAGDGAPLIDGAAPTDATLVDAGGYADAGSRPDAVSRADASGGGDSGAASRDGGADAAAVATKKGVSAWVYSNEDALANELLAYDTAVQSQADGMNRRLRYLFPYGGGVAISGTAIGSETVSYDPTAAAFYAARLPYPWLFPIVDSGDGANLTQWSASDQEALAAEVATPILNDPNARGVQVDIEPYNDAQVPFYTKLRALLNAGSKTLTVFTGKSSGPIYGAVDVVVLSGYDLGISPVTTANYTTTLGRNVAAAVASAVDAGAQVIVGVPAAASYEEYSTLSGTCDGGTGYTQQQWLAAAWQAVCPHYSDNGYLGLSLWEVASAPLAVPKGATCLRNPGEIEDASWTALADFDPSSCP